MKLHATRREALLVVSLLLGACSTNNNTTGTSSSSSSSGGSATSTSSGSGGTGTTGGTTGTGGSTGGGCSAGCPSGFSCDAASGLCKNSQGIPHFTHVWVIIEENTNYSSINGNTTDAPFINDTLIAGGVKFSNYQDTGAHPSLPNYLAVVGGDTFGIQSDGDASDPSLQIPATNQDIASQLAGAGLTWHSYVESMTQPCELGEDSNYLAWSKHNPMPFFLITQNSASCAANDVSFEPETGMPGLAADVAGGVFYSFNFIVPNICNDGHGNSAAGCPASLALTDTWLSHHANAILGSSAYKQNGLLVVTWDEGEGGADQIMTIALSPMLASGTHSNGTAYTHYSLLATIEAGFGLPNLAMEHGHNDALITDIWK